MKKYKDIQSLLSYVRRAVDDFDMIRQDETVAVGVGIEGGVGYTESSLCHFSTITPLSVIQVILTNSAFLSLLNP